MWEMSEEKEYELGELAELLEWTIIAQQRIRQFRSTTFIAEVWGVHEKLNLSRFTFVLCV